MLKKWVEEDPVNRVRLNYDDIRCMLGKYWVPEREPLIHSIFILALIESMNNGYDIIIDNMSNLNPKHQEEYKKLTEQHSFTSDFKYEIEYKLFDTPVEICIERDSKREVPIGEKVIRQQWRKYREYIIGTSIKEMLNKQPVPKLDLPDCIIVDMDATLCFNTEMRPFFGSGAAENMHKDIPNLPICSLVRNYCDAVDCALIVVTERDEPCREATMQWLAEHWLYPTKLLMRPEGSMISGPEQKKLIYEHEIKDKYNVVFVLEDNSKVVQMYRDLGLTVLQVNEGKF